MAGKTFGTLVAEVTANINPFKKKMDDASKQSQGFAKKSKSSFDKAAKAFKAFAAVVGAAAFLRSVDNVLTKLDSIAKTADKLGVPIEKLQELRFAAEQTGVSAGTLDMAMQRFTRRVAEAQVGTGELKDTLKQYGIALTDAQGNQRNVNDIFDDYVNTISGASSESEALRLAFKGFDSEGAALVNTFRDGTDGLEDFAEQARKAGLIIDEGLVRSAEEAREKVDVLKKQFGAEFAKVIAENAEEIQILAKAITDLISITLKGIRGLRGAINEAFGNFDNLTDEQLVDSYAEKVRDLAKQEEHLNRIRESGKKGMFGGNKLQEDLEENIRLLKEEMELIEKIQAYREAEKSDSSSSSPTTPKGKPPPTPAQLKKEAQEIGEVRVNAKKRELTFAEKLAIIDKEEADRKREAKEALEDLGVKYGFITEKAIVYREEIAELDRLYKEGIIPSQDAYNEAIEKLGDEVEDSPFAGLIEELTDFDALLRQTAADSMNSMADSIADMVVDGKASFNDLAQSILKDIAKMIIKMLIFKALESSLGGTSIGNFLGISKSAGGGLLAPNKVALVGERGPELIMPSAPSRVLNNHALRSGAGGGVGGTGNITVEIVNRGTPQQAVSSSSNSLGVKGAIVSIVTEDIRKNGPIASSLGQTFGVRRQS